MNVQAIRKTAGLTQQQLANKSGIHRVTLARIENGTAKPGSDTLRALSTALGCTIDELMGAPPPPGGRGADRRAVRADA